MVDKVARTIVKKQAGSHRLARGFHSRWNESDMYDFVNGAIDDINRNTYSDIMAGNLNSYEGADGEVYTFDIMSDYFTLYVEVDGTNVSISCEDDPSLDQAWDFDEDYSSSNLADDLSGIASDAEEVFIEMSEAEDSFDAADEDDALSYFDDAIKPDFSVMDRVSKKWISDSIDGGLYDSKDFC